MSWLKTALPTRNAYRSLSLDYSYLLRRQPIQPIHQPVDLPVRGLDLPLNRRLHLRVPLGRQLAVQLQHSRHQCHHLVVPRRVGGVGEVDGADGKQ